MTRATTPTAHHGTPQYVRSWPPYRLPDPLASFEDLERFENADVPHLSPVQRWAEHRAATQALAHIVRSGHDACIWYGLEHVRASDWLARRMRATKAGAP
jgi:hypothetical protein